MHSEQQNQKEVQHLLDLQSMIATLDLTKAPNRNLLTQYADEIIMIRRGEVVGLPSNINNKQR